MRIVKTFLILICFSISSNVWAISKNTESACPDPEWVCPYFGSLLGLSCTFEGVACEGKDCEGVYRGEEIEVVATGSQYSKWITRHDGVVSLEGYGLPCDLTVGPDVTQVIVPGTACAFSLITEAKLYMEHFSSNPIYPCFGFVECPCDLPE
jgi:hypothetical protein